MIRLAKARKAASRMNGYEAEYEKLFLGKLVHYYASVTLRLGDDCRYTPDWLVIAEDDVVEFHEVKGGFWRDGAKEKIRTASELYPMFRFVAWAKVKGQWSRQRFGPVDA